MNRSNVRESDSFLSYLANSVGVTINLMINVIPFTITFALLKNSKDELAIPAFSIILACYMYFYGYLVTFQETIGICCTPSFSISNPEEFSKNFYRMVIINFLFLSVSIILTVFSHHLLILANIREELVHVIYLLLLKTLPAKILENLSNLCKGLLIAMDQFKIFYIVNIITSGAFITAIYLAIKKFGFGLDGFAIALSIKAIVELICLLVIVYCKIDPVYLSLSQWRHFLDDFLSKLYFTCVIAMSTYFETIACFISTIILAQTKNENMVVSFTIYQDFALYFYYPLLGCYSYMRTQLLIAIGQKDSQKFIRQKKTFVMYSIYFTLILTGIWIIIFPYLSILYTKKRLVAEQVNITLFVHTPIIILNGIIVSYNGLLKIIGKEKTQFKLSLYVFCPTIIILEAFFVLVLKLDVYGCMLGALFATIAFLLSLVFAYSQYEKDFVRKLNNSIELQEEQIEIVSITED